jgi:hypothetical protein
MLEFPRRKQDQKTPKTEMVYPPKRQNIAQPMEKMFE